MKTFETSPEPLLQCQVVVVLDQAIDLDVRVVHRQLEHAQYAISTREHVLGVKAQSQLLGSVFKGDGTVGNCLDLITGGRYALEAENRRRRHVQDLTDKEAFLLQPRSGTAWNSLLPTTCRIMRLIDRDRRSSSVKIHAPFSA